MANLKYKTRGNVTPQGKPRVYFCCHSNDFEKYFEPISGEILATQNCAIWYLADAATGRDEDFFADLKQMQLFVMPITTNLLCTENDALDADFRFAVENHIPVLPLMQESGLEKLFNQKCGELQFLDKYHTDNTAINYEEKLEKYLSSVLIGDELAEKIRAAFDAYVFLSYRKKDRKYAQKLMRLIHQNEFCRDIAIWYDEFLTPGENFNDSIKEALQKSGLFVLTVTPNLVNEANYIMTTEYPMAKQEGKPILPVELVPTDRRLLSEKYADLPDCTDAHNESQLSEALLMSIRKIAIRENNASPEHSFFIGLAYLGGIDVEVDPVRALSLIVSAADADLPMAAQKLFHMYLNGIGVARDLKQAAHWKEKEVQIYQDIFAREHNEENFIHWFSSAEELCDFYSRTLSLTEKALEIYKDFENNIPASILNNGKLEIVSIIGELYMQIGGIYTDRMDTALAEKYLQKAEGLIAGIHIQQKNILSAMVKDDAETGVKDMVLYYAKDTTRLSLLCESLAFLYRQKGQDDRHEQLLLKVLKLRQELCDLFPGHYVFEINLIIALLNLSRYYSEQKNYARAQEYILPGEARAVDLANQTHSLHAGEYQMQFVSLKAAMYFEQHDIQKARECYEFSIHCISRSEKTPALITLLAENHINLAELFLQTNQFNHAQQQLAKAEEAAAEYGANQKLLDKIAEAKEKINTNELYIKGVDAYYHRLISENQQSMNNGYSEEKMFDLLCLLFQSARLYYNGKQYEVAEHKYLLALKTCNFLLRSDLREKVIPHAYLLYKELSDVYVKLDLRKKAEKCIKKLIKIGKKNVNKNLNDAAYCLLITAYQDVGDFYKNNNDMNHAKKYYMSAMNYTGLLLQVFGGDKNLDFAADYYFNTGILDAPQVDKQLLHSAYQIWSDLSDRHPDNTTYREKISKVKSILEQH